LTDALGVAAFSYAGTANGNDTVTATAGTAVSNTAAISWITPVAAVSTTPVLSRWFLSDGGGTFNKKKTDVSCWEQAHPAINFNPPFGTIPGNTSGVGVSTVPFTNVTTDLNGNFTGTIVAEGNGYRAAVLVPGGIPRSVVLMRAFQSVFTGTLTVASAGDVVCAEQRIAHEGLSPSGAQMRSAVSERGGNASRAREGREVWRSLTFRNSETTLVSRIYIKGRRALEGRGGTEFQVQPLLFPASRVNRQCFVRRH